MLKKIRVAIAIACFVIIVLLFLDISGVLHKNFAFLAQFQFVPALLALNVVVLRLLPSRWFSGEFTVQLSARREFIRISCLFSPDELSREKRAVIPIPPRKRY